MFFCFLFFIHRQVRIPQMGRIFIFLTYRYKMFDSPPLFVAMFSSKCIFFAHFHSFSVEFGKKKRVTK